MALNTGFVQRIKGKLRAHVLFLGDGGIVARNGAQVFGAAAMDALTAHAGGTRALAIQLGAGWNRLSVVANANDSAALPAAKAGLQVLVINDGVAAAKIFAMSGTTDTIDGVAAATGVALTNAKRAIYFCLTDGAWQSLQGGVSA